jgi:hypothetical protein
MNSNKHLEQHEHMSIYMWFCEHCDCLLLVEATNMYRMGYMYYVSSWSDVIFYLYSDIYHLQASN